jgi:hypothetical protein
LKILSSPFITKELENMIEHNHIIRPSSFERGHVPAKDATPTVGAFAGLANSAPLAAFNQAVQNHEFSAENFDVSLLMI